MISLKPGEAGDLSKNAHTYFTLKLPIGIEVLNWSMVNDQHSIANLAEKHKKIISCFDRYKLSSENIRAVNCFV